ncbi:hypothetical protein J1N10_01425 [Carboxylicivirga sp. A043]|uniref:hypothetical protein n=1 Tax=Carboxylicivirga litoralis TaxID=2816963 RepID=UPI0021CB800A|nr:hypothetical protein [Carboxylicivirga sp. A043]MCU4154616.1 hypothetical protein [Carboxylicivirga sp. A043]
MMKKILYIVLGCMLLLTTVDAQTDSTAVAVEQNKPVKPEKRYKKVYWGLKAGGGQMLWDNDLDSYSGEAITPLNGGFFIEYRPIKYVGIETGASYFIGSFKGSIESYATTLKGVDSEGDDVSYRFSANELEESQDLALLNVPIAIKLNAFAGNWEFFAKGGVEYRHALTATYEQSGKFTNQAYYEQWDLLIDDLLNQGFYTNRSVSESGDLLWKDAFEPFVGGGIVFPSRKTAFFIEGIYYLGSSDYIEKQAAPFENRIGNVPASKQSSGSIMEMGVTNMSGFIVNIGLRF